MRRKSCSEKRKKTPGEQSPRCGFTEDDIRERFAQEELSDDKQREAIQSLIDAGEYDHAAKLANEAITEAVAHMGDTFDD